METAAALSLTLVCFLLVVSGCHSLHHSPVESLRRSLRALPEQRREAAVSPTGLEGSVKEGNSSIDVAMAARQQNVTVPQFLRELYLDLEEPSKHLYPYVNSILSYENKAINNTQCDWMTFGLPQYDEDTAYVKSELKVFHRVPADQLSAMTGKQRRLKYNTYLCYQYKFWCIPFTRNITVTPSTDGLMTFTFNPKTWLKTLKLKTLNIRIRVVNSKGQIPCADWPLNFVTDDSLGKDRVPLLVTYMKQPEDSVLSLFLNEAVRNAPIPAPSVQPELLPRQQEREESRQKREDEIVKPCERQSLLIQAGWSLSATSTFSNTFDIGFCGGHCSAIYESKSDERAAFLNLARRRGYISPDEYPESCVPHEKENLNVIIIPEENAFEIIMLHNLVVTSCVCVL